MLTVNIGCGTRLGKSFNQHFMILHDKYANWFFFYSLSALKVWFCSQMKVNDLTDKCIKISIKKLKGQ